MVPSASPRITVMTTNQVPTTSTGTKTIQAKPATITSIVVITSSICDLHYSVETSEAAGAREGAGAETEGGDAGVAASFSGPSFFGPVVLSESRSAAVGFSWSR